MWVRIKALIIKELLAMLRDKRGRFTLIIPPLIQLFILAQAITLEVKNISVVYYNQDSGWYSHELIARVKGSPYFTHVYNVDSPSHFEKMIDDQNALVGIEIKNDFSAELAKGNNPSIGIVLDGRRSNAAQIVQGYLLRIIENFNVDIQIQLNTFSPPLVQGLFRSWFNPNILSRAWSAF
ncbi:MAG TPA: ABC transporter permease [Candidatus Berkiella sp.]|nr:ABC transporter permease [Candidatus Berkiella sp.]